MQNSNISPDLYSKFYGKSDLCSNFKGDQSTHYRLIFTKQNKTNPFFFRTSAKYRYRFVCRNRTEKLARGINPNEQENLNCGNNRRRNSMIPESMEEQEPLAPNVCAHCRKKEAHYQLKGDISPPPLDFSR